MKKTLFTRTAALLTMLVLALVITGVPGIALADVTSVSITPPASSSILVGEQVTLTGAALPGGTPGLTYAWTVNNSNVSLSSPTSNTTNTITGRTAGSSTVRLTAYDTADPTGDYAEQSITVTPMSVLPSSSIIGPSSTVTLTASNFTGTISSWVSSNPAVATVASSGAATALVTAVGSGTTTITATNTPNNGAPAQVITATVTVPTVTLSPASQTLTSGSAMTSLTLSVTNGGSVISTPGATVNWSSSDGTIGALSATTSTVNASGVATIYFTSSAAATNGTTTITATVGGFTRTATVTVSTAKHLDITGPDSLSNTSRTGTYTVYLKNPDGTVYDDDTSTVHWSWSSSYLSITSDDINDSRADMHNGEAHIQLYARYNTPSSGTRLYAWINDDSGNRVYHTIVITGLSSLPQTGQDMTLVYVFGGLGAALLAAAGVWYGIRKKHSAA